MLYSINLGDWNDIFIIPRSIVTKYLKLAKEDYIKVLLVLLSSSDITEQEIAEKSGISVENIGDAIKFWQDCKIITNNQGNISPAKVDNGRSSDITEVKSDNQENVKSIDISKNVKVKTREPVRLSSLEVSQRINSADELKWLVSEAEKLFGRFLNQSETNTLVSMFDYAGISADVIVMIIEYCISIEKSNIRFIEKTAYSWADMGIDNHQKVEAHITSLITEKNNESLIKTAFGIWNQNLTSKQKEFIKLWLEDFEFSIEMIKIAYEMCVDNTGKLSFPYINRILNNWHEKNIKTPLDVEQIETTRKQNEKIKETFDANEFDGIEGYSVPSLKTKKK